MVKAPELDTTAAHKHFAASCFNEAWELIEKPGRSLKEDRLMVALSQASIYHWLNRPDVEAKNLSIGYWQLSRIHAILGNASEAQRNAEICQDYSDDLEPFYICYAYEALARAASIAGDSQATANNLQKALEYAPRVTNVNDRELLKKDLESIL